MRVGSKIVFLTVGLVVLAGVLSAGATFFHTRNLSVAYDEALKEELEQKALAYSAAATTIFDALGPEGLPTVQAILESPRSESTPGDTATGF